jgi:hypothetical protein
MSVSARVEDEEDESINREGQFIWKLGKCWDRYQEIKLIFVIKLKGRLTSGNCWYHSFEMFYFASEKLETPGTTWVEVEVEVNVRPTVSRPVCLGIGIPSGAHDQISFISLTIAGFLISSTLSEERTGL